MLDVLTILEYARKGALADYEKACVMHRLLNIKETQAMVDDAWGTAKELTRLMDLKAEQVKQTGRDTKEDARKRVVSADRFVQPNEQALHKQVIAEAPYVLVIKWNTPSRVTPRLRRTLRSPSVKLAITTQPKLMCTNRAKVSVFP